MNFKQTCEQLESLIQDSYRNGVTMSQAEMLAGRFLEAQLLVSRELTASDLDSRMRRSGVKAIRAAIYLEERSKPEKVTEGTLTAIIDSNPDVRAEQDQLDKVESERDELKRLLDVFSNSHIHYRTISKGGFGG
jgi:hypothetical protein